MDILQLGRWASRTTGLAIIALAVTLVWQHRSLAAAHRQQRAWVTPVQQSIATDGLIGNRLPSLSFTSADGAPVSVPAAGAHHLLWFVQPAECIGCIGNGPQ